MRLSHQYKFLFISKPKCASESIRRTLNPYSDIKSQSTGPYYHHATALKMKKHFEQNKWAWENYHKFISVRNPWDMIVSLYFFGKPDMNGLYFWDSEKNGRKYISSAPMDFNIWIKSNNFYFWTLNNFILDEHGNLLVNDIIKSEELEKGLKIVMGKIGIKKYKIYKINTTNHKNYRHYYDDETKNRIASLFEMDIEIGKYLF